MKYLLRFALVFAFASAPRAFLSSCGPDTPTKPTQLRGNFAEAALPVLNTIERAHLHILKIREETPQAAVERLLTYAHTDVEKEVAKKLGHLLVIVEANSDEYFGCDAKIKTALLSREWPNSFYPECR